MKMVGSPVAGCIAMETPPTPHRPQVVKSGSIAMLARVLAPLVRVERPGVGDVEAPAVVGGADEAERCRAQQPVLDRRAGPQPDPGSGRLGAGPVHAPTPGLEGIDVDELPHGVV